MKAAVLVHAFEKYAAESGEVIEHQLLHTGQHYDTQMSDVFFQELGLRKPDIALHIGSGPHGIQTAAMLATIEGSLHTWRPDAVIVYGDTNSTLAGALAAVKIHIPVVHVEAGLRSFNRAMPEEINRIVSDHVASLLLCPTKTAVLNLEREGLADRSVLVGDVMLDAALYYVDAAADHNANRIPQGCGDGYALVTLHRAENTDNPHRLKELLEVLSELPLTVVLPVHPRLKKQLGDEGMQKLQHMRHMHLQEPASYFEMLALEKKSRLILTDSGGVQKEAYFFGVPCITLRGETEWTETVAGGWNYVAGCELGKVPSRVESLIRGNGAMPYGVRDLENFGGGNAGRSAALAILQMGKRETR
ncbi:MAG: non-hydrolyzing UDP-N-acetylglucosamine 2-epimerase [Acidobacteriaceae bacterium]